MGGSTGFIDVSEAHSRRSYRYDDWDDIVETPRTILANQSDRPSSPRRSRCMMSPVNTRSFVTSSAAVSYVSTRRSHRTRADKIIALVTSSSWTRIDRHVSVIGLRGHHQPPLPHEVVSQKRYDKRSRVAAPQALDTLRRPIHVVSVHVDVERQERVYPRIDTEFPPGPVAKAPSPRRYYPCFGRGGATTPEVFDLDFAALFVAGSN